MTASRRKDMVRKDGAPSLRHRVYPYDNGVMTVSAIIVDVGDAPSLKNMFEFPRVL